MSRTCHTVAYEGVSCAARSLPRTLKMVEHNHSDALSAAWSFTFKEIEEHQADGDSEKQHQLYMYEWGSSWGYPTQRHYHPRLLVKVLLNLISCYLLAHIRPCTSADSLWAQCLAIATNRLVSEQLTWTALCCTQIHRHFIKIHKSTHLVYSYIIQLGRKQHPQTRIAFTWLMSPTRKKIRTQDSSLQGGPVGWVVCHYNEDPFITTQRKTKRVWHVEAKKDGDGGTIKLMGT